MGVEDGSQEFAGAGTFTRSLGHTIKVLRVDQCQTRKQLGEKAGISYSYVSQIENGRRPPSSPVLLRIAEALGLSASDLLACSERTAAFGEPSGSRLANTTLNARPQPSARGRLTQPVEKSQVSGMVGSSSPAVREAPGGGEPGAALDELSELLTRLSPEDLERVPDLARRLAG